MFFNQANISQSDIQSSLQQKSVLNQEFDPEFLVNQSHQKNDSPLQEMDLIDFQEENEIQNEFYSPQSPTQKAQKDDLNASMRSRTSHRSLQKQILQRYSRGNSPIRLIKNESFFKDQEDFDLSQLGDFQQEEIDFSQVNQKNNNKEELQQQQVYKKDQLQIIIKNKFNRDIFGLSKMINQEEFKQEPVQIVKVETKKKQVQFAVEEEENLREQQDLNQINQVEDDSQKPQRSLEVWKQIQFNDSKIFLLSPIPVGKILQCHIKRETSGKCFFYPVYHLYISESNTYLMTIKRLAGQKTSKYLMTYNKDELSRKSKFFLGIVRSNFIGTEFMIYSKGENPKLTQEHDSISKQLHACKIKTAPRQFKVFLPAIINGVPLTYRPIMSREGLVLESQLQEKRDQTYHEFRNKLPIWDPKRNGYVLVFNERVNRTSVKNFQLQQFNKNGMPSQISQVQFGRHSVQGFTLDIQYPFNPLQAFATAITTFDTKIACD